MTINTIYIPTYRGDLPLTRICVASIRYWYPNIPIFLIKDFGAGHFSTREIEITWNVQVLATTTRQFGWGFSKLEPLFIDKKEKFLVVDSDTVFTGSVLDVLDKHEEQFIVDDETQSEEEVRRLYYAIQELKAIDPHFHPCGKNFNSGQWVGTSGIITRDDFAHVVHWSEPPVLKFPSVFMPGDQGVLNYILEKIANNGRCSIARVPLMWWAPRDIAGLDLDLMARQSPYTRIIHWAGCKLHSKHALPREDILSFFESFYYSRVVGGAILCRGRRWVHYVEHIFGKLKLRLMKRNKQ